MKRVKTYIRIKPTLTKEPIINVQSVSDLEQICDEKYKKFTQNYIFNENCSQNDVYNKTLQPSLGKLFQGNSCCFITQGMTGSGKTQTCGFNDVEINSDGILYYTLKDILEMKNYIKSNKDKIGYNNMLGYDLRNISDISLNISMIQIYNDKIQDLLSQNKEINIREHIGGGIQLENITEAPFQSLIQITSTLNKGISNRISASQKMNNTSSRSHIIIEVNLSILMVNSSIQQATLQICDLAGNERVNNSQSRGVRLEEAKHINTSLSCLSKCIRQVSCNQSNIPFRDSKLTRQFKDIFTNNQSEILVLGCVNNEFIQNGETLTTLKFIKSCTVLNKNVSINLWKDEKQMHIKDLSCLLTNLSQREKYLLDIMAKNEQYVNFKNTNEPELINEYKESRKNDNQDQEIIVLNELFMNLSKIYQKCCQKPFEPKRFDEFNSIDTINSYLIDLINIIGMNMSYQDENQNKFVSIINILFNSLKENRVQINKEIQDQISDIIDSQGQFNDDSQVSNVIDILNKSQSENTTFFTPTHLNSTKYSNELNDTKFNDTNNQPFYQNTIPNHTIKQSISNFNSLTKKKTKSELDNILKDTIKKNKEDIKLQQNSNNSNSNITNIHYDDNIFEAKHSETCLEDENSFIQVNRLNLVEETITSEQSVKEFIKFETNLNENEFTIPEIGEISNSSMLEKELDEILYNSKEKIRYKNQSQTKSSLNPDKQSVIRTDNESFMSNTLKENLNAINVDNERQFESNLNQPIRKYELNNIFDKSIKDDKHCLKEIKQGECTMQETCEIFKNAQECIKEINQNNHNINQIINKENY